MLHFYLIYLWVRAFYPISRFFCVYLCFCTRAVKKEDGQVETINVLTNKEMLLKVSSHPNVLEIKRQVFAQAEKDNLFPAAGMWDSTIMDNREVENEKQIDDDVRLITIRYDLTKGQS
eukprot:GHVT01010314.1.p1 GENE.GHVT01010314.1~~GHVT01010314.1.p1  ORF type:complete len:118 (+),score=8.44 GHVT01010314.1:466-819(+)